jgi:peptidyl-prolyl cis-trans isomerase-like 4
VTVPLFVRASFQADIKPPENVLFVCKLNPITNDEDLETIFSRFGDILSCEIVRDKKTSESLCYAFIEYDNEEDAEQAYLKMDNVLIDDRRIHVDFSQSVAKAKWEYDKKQRKLKAIKAQQSFLAQRTSSTSQRPVVELRSHRHDERKRIDESRSHRRDERTHADESRSYRRDERTHDKRPSSSHRNDRHRSSYQHNDRHRDDRDQYRRRRDRSRS